VSSGTVWLVHWLVACAVSVGDAIGLFRLANQRAWCDRRRQSNSNAHSHARQFALANRYGDALADNLAFTIANSNSFDDANRYRQPDPHPKRHAYLSLPSGRGE
jgi:hypothetical protein